MIRSTHIKSTCRYTQYSSMCTELLEKCRHCGASLREFACVAHGRAYAAVQTYMYVDVRTHVRKLCVESALPSALYFFFLFFFCVVELLLAGQ